jgi:hypothetical protein
MHNGKNSILIRVVSAQVTLPISRESGELMNDVDQGAYCLLEALLSSPALTSAARFSPGGRSDTAFETREYVPEQCHLSWRTPCVLG